MKWSIALVATVLLSSARVAAAQSTAGATSEGFLAAQPHAEQARDLRVQTAGVAPARTIAIVWAFVMMTVIAYRRLDQKAP